MGFAGVEIIVIYIQFAWVINSNGPIKMLTASGGGNLNEEVDVGRGRA